MEELIETVTIGKPRMQLSYYMIRSGSMAGVAIRDADGAEASRLLPGTETEVRSFIHKIAARTVTPVSLDGIADDYIRDIFLF